MVEESFHVMEERYSFFFYINSRAHPVLYLPKKANKRKEKRHSELSKFLLLKVFSF